MSGSRRLVPTARLVTAEQYSEWHPLSGHEAPEYVPAVWTPTHAGQRLADGLRTLRQMPVAPGPREFGGSWPAWSYEWADLLAQQEMESDQRELIERQKNRTRIRPSARQIAEMERTISWPATYLRHDQRVLRAVQACSLCRARGLDLDRAAHRLRIAPHILRARYLRGLDHIAAGLTRDNVAVF
jgi:hypothetical protein